MLDITEVGSDELFELMAHLSLDFKEIALIDKYEGFQEKPHIHAWFDISFIIKGSFQYEIDGRLLPVSDGDLIVVPPGKSHRELCDQSREFEVLFIDLNFLNDGVPFNIAERLNIPEVTRLDNLKEIYQIFECILNEVVYQHEGYLLKVKAQVYNLLVAICRNSSNETPTVDTLKKINNLRKRKITEDIKAYMGENYARKLSLSDLSGQFYLSPQYISSLFKATSGYSPIEYLNKVRIRKAKEMFDAGHDNIGQVAEAIGIGNIHYFYRLFRQYENTTPAQYLAKQKKSENS